jgi:thymidine kinase
MCALNQHCEMCSRLGNGCDGLYQETAGNPTCFEEDKDDIIDYAGYDEYEAACRENYLKD